MLKYLIMLAGTCLSLAALAAPITIPADAGTRLAAAENAISALQSALPAAPAVTPAPDGTTNTVAVQAKNHAGASLSAYRVMRVWISQTARGAASTNGVESLVLSGGSALSTGTANADYWYVSSATGTVSAVVIGSAAGTTNYINISDGGAVTAAAVVFE